MKELANYHITLRDNFELINWFIRNIRNDKQTMDFYRN
jgi:hypothetical protein